MGANVAFDTNGVGVVPFPIPGATPGGVLGKLLNLDPSKGMIATMIRIEPGARIPAHFHLLGAESHFVVEGDFVENGVAFGPGAFFTHPKGAVHGPHESRTGCWVLTVQEAFVDPAAPDFHIAADA